MSDESTDKKSVFQLIADLPGLVTTLIKDEIESLKQELVARLKNAGIGIGFFAGAAVFGYFAILVLIATAILGIVALGLPGWLSALIIAVVLLIITAILALVGLRKVKKGVPPVPESSINSVKSDVNAFKGVGSYDR